MLESDPSQQIKDELNKIIQSNNAVANHIKLPKLVGEYRAGYIYGNSKLHKNINNPPIRPIISQIPSPTYTIAKELNKIIEPYVPSKYILKSTDDLLDILQINQPKGILSSLDVESLYTNVPIDTTIDIILQNVYNHESKPPPKIEKSTLKKLLEICTKHAPFMHIDGKIFQQTDGIAMGSPLGCVFANYYMANLENSIISNIDNPPTLYARYIDDIIIVVENQQQLFEIKEQFQNNSVLNFTHEIGNHKLAFLDVSIENENDQLKTSVYTKSTNKGELLNYYSECPEKYKKGVITTMVHRAYKISSTREKFNEEIDRLKKVFANNNYPTKVIDQCIQNFHNKINNIEQQPKQQIKIYYKNQMNQQYKKDEKVIKDIIKKNVQPISPDEEINFIIYYSNMKTKNLFMKNNISTSVDFLSKSWVVYKYKCPHEDCVLQNPTYIGQTRNTLRKRLQQHKIDGAIKDHLYKKHNKNIEEQQIEQNTKIINSFQNLKELHIFEALAILQEQPDINRQKDNFINPLKLFSRSNGAPTQNNSTIETRTRHTYNLRSVGIS